MLQPRAHPSLVEDASAITRRTPRIIAVILGLLTTVLFVAGLWSAYLYYKRGGCHAMLGWWEVAPVLFWLSVVASATFWVTIVLMSRRFRGLALFGAGLAIGLWLMFGVWSTVEGHRLQQLYKVGAGIPSSAPLPADALSTDPNWCYSDLG